MPVLRPGRAGRAVGRRRARRGRPSTRSRRARTTPDFDALWEPFPLGVAPSGAYVAALAPERRDALREALRAGLGDPRGAFTLPARAWCVTGRAPGQG